MHQQSPLDTQDMCTKIEWKSISPSKTCWDISHPHKEKKVFLAAAQKDLRGVWKCLENETIYSSFLYFFQRNSICFCGSNVIHANNYDCTDMWASRTAAVPHTVLTQELSQHYFYWFSQSIHSRGFCAHCWAWKFHTPGIHIHWVNRQKLRGRLYTEHYMYLVFRCVWLDYIHM